MHAVAFQFTDSAELPQAGGDHSRLCGHIDNQWYASRYANRLRRIAEGGGLKEIQKESPEQWFARKIFDKEGSN